MSSRTFMPTSRASRRRARSACPSRGRSFPIQKQFLEDVRAQRVREHVRSIGAALLVLHSPTDETVGIENASAIFTAARHPKSFVALDGADHLLTDKRDGLFAARMISAWSARYLDLEEAEETHEARGVRVAESGGGKFQQLVSAGPHCMLADEPTDVGGLGSGPTPYEFVAIGLAACTSMTIRIYAAFKSLELGRIAVEVDHEKVHAIDADGGAGKIDRLPPPHLGRRAARRGDPRQDPRDRRQVPGASHASRRRAGGGPTLRNCNGSDSAA